MAAGQGLAASVCGGSLVGWPVAFVDGGAVELPLTLAIRSPRTYPGRGRPLSCFVTG